MRRAASGAAADFEAAAQCLAVAEQEAGRVVSEVVASYFVAVDTDTVVFASYSAVVAESYLVCESSAGDLCYWGTENLGSAS